MKTQLTLLLPASYPGSLHFHLLAVCIIMMTACSVLKEKSFYQADSLHRQDSSREILTDIRTQTKAVTIHASETASDAAYSVEIVPKGKFKFSATEGFDGEAASFIISGRSQHRQNEQNVLKSTKTGVIRATSKSSQRTLAKGQVKTKELQTINFNFLYWGACLLIFILIYVFRKRLSDVVDFKSKRSSRMATRIK